MLETSKFRLDKWYLDCVSDEGDVVIVYAAELRWRRLHLHYSSVLTRLEGKNQTSTALEPCRVDANSTVRIDCGGLGLSGNWSPLGEPIDESLLDLPQGVIDWHCVQPKSQASVQVGQNTIRGLGYAEHLILTLPPWKLPFTRLQWGRALSANDSVVWIDWSGELSRRWVWKDGRPQDPNTLDVTGVRFSPTEHVRLSRVATLREGHLGTAVLPSAPTLRRVFPRALFGIHERKWLSTAEHVSGQRRDSGWAIHEVVDSMP